MNIELHAEIGPQRSPFNDPERHKGDQSADPAHFDARRARKLASKHRWQLPQTFSHDLGHKWKSTRHSEKLSLHYRRDADALE